MKKLPVVMDFAGEIGIIFVGGLQNHLSYT